MKIFLVVLLVGLCAAASVVKEQRNGQSVSPKIQRDILLILQNINQQSSYEKFVDIGNTYNVSQNQNQYTNPQAVQQFLQYYNNGVLLPRGQVFSVFYQSQLQQAIALFNLLYYAQDYETFYNTSVWARQNLNEGLFLYSFTVAVVHRPDTQNAILPPIYEVYPYYFINTDAIQQAYIYKQQYGGQTTQQGGNNAYTINYNYSGYYLNLGAEQSLSYYLEDVGISSFYYYYNTYYPFWLSSQQYGFQNVNRGEQYYFLYQQLLARYYLERISNGLGEIPYLSRNSPVETPYYPSLEYPNGLEFPSRPAFANLEEYVYNYGQQWTTNSVYGYSLSFVQDYERRISDAIDSGYVFARGQRIELYSPEGLNTLGNLIQGNPDSPNNKYYGAVWLYASHLLGYSYQPLNNNQIAPSALEQFETALRDPAFYQLYKRIILLFQRYYSNIEPYTPQELAFQGVKVNQFQVDRLTTYDDDFYVDLSNAVYYSQQEQQQRQQGQGQGQGQQGGFNVRARQTRLNNKPFTYRVNVQSEAETKAVVKVFLGPVYDQYGRYINLTQNRLNMVLLDYFVYELKSGENIISRNSYDSQLYGPDPVSNADLLRQFGQSEGQSQQSQQGQQSQQNQQNYFYYPQRYILPRGSNAGVPYQFYVIVYPYVPKQGQQQQPQQQQQQSQTYESYYYPFVGTQQFYDNYTLGYPFDRFIQYEQLFYQVPNSAFYQTKVYHAENVNAVQGD